MDNLFPTTTVFFKTNGQRSLGHCFNKQLANSNRNCISKPFFRPMHSISVVCKLQQIFKNRSAFPKWAKNSKPKNVSAICNLKTARSTYALSSLLKRMGSMPSYLYACKTEICKVKMHMQHFEMDNFSPGCNMILAASSLDRRARNS